MLQKIFSLAKFISKFRTLLAIDLFFRSRIVKPKFFFIDRMTDKIFVTPKSTSLEITKSNMYESGKSYEWHCYQTLDNNYWSTNILKYNSIRLDLSVEFFSWTIIAQRKRKRARHNQPFHIQHSGEH